MRKHERGDEGEKSRDEAKREGGGAGERTKRKMSLKGGTAGNWPSLKPQLLPQRGCGEKKKKKTL